MEQYGMIRKLTCADFQNALDSMNREFGEFLADRQFFVNLTVCSYICICATWSRKYTCVPFLRTIFRSFGFLTIMPSLRVRCCTWNVGDEGPPEDDLNKFLGLQEKDLPDIVGVALQEVVEDDEWRRRFIECLQPCGFVLIKSRNCWAIWMLLFVRRNLLSAITNIESEVTPCGFVGVMGNKGGVSVRFEICGVNVIFLSCHFAAHAKRTQDRLNDYLDIIAHQSFRDDDVHTILDHDYVFWMGDLNFRLENIDKTTAEMLIRQNRLEELLEHDQLLQNKRKQLTFVDFQEGEIHFPPTFKFDKGTSRYDSSSKQRVPAWTDRILYMSHRDFAMDIPTDLTRRKEMAESRYTPTRGTPSDAARNYLSSKRASMGPYQPKVALHEYTSLSEYLSSDHRPVVATFTFAVPPRWFSLPISFLEPMAREHSLDADLEFTYTLLDPPALLLMTETDRILSTRPSVASVDFIHLMLISALGRMNQPETEETQEPSPSAPSALEQASWDWIGLYPADVVDLEKGYITYVRAPKACRSAIREALAPISKGHSGPIFKGKVASRYLRELGGIDVQLVYWSRNKNCPQGYSPIVRITD